MHFRGATLPSVPPLIPTSLHHHRNLSNATQLHKVISGEIQMNSIDLRHAAKLKVKIEGKDSSGNTFKQVAYTHDVSQRGARLTGAPSLIAPRSIVEVHHGWKKGRFRVVWVGGPGTSEDGQAGLESLDPNACIWGKPLPGVPISRTQQL